MEFSIFQPWNEFVLRGVLPKDLFTDLIELTDIISQDIQKESSNSSLAGEIKNEWVIDNSLLVNIRFMPFLFELLEEYIKIVKIQSTPKDTHLESTDEYPLQINNYEQWRLESAWFNDQIDNEYNPSHNHSGVISGVLYLKIPEYLSPRKNKHTDGAITFLGNSGPNDGLFTVPQFSILPKERDIFIFPSSLRHEVYPFRTENGQGIRRSLSFNIHLPFPTTFRNG